MDDVAVGGAAAADPTGALLLGIRPALAAVKPASADDDGLADSKQIQQNPTDVDYHTDSL